MERDIKKDTNEKYYKEEYFNYADSGPAIGQNFQKDKICGNNAVFDGEYVEGIEEDPYLESNTEKIIFKLASEYLPPCIIVDQKGKLIYVSGDSGKYLKIPWGKASLNIFRMLPGNVPHILKDAIDKIKAERAEVVYSNIIFESDNQARIADLKIKPFYIDKYELFIVIFFIEKQKGFNDFNFEEKLSQGGEIRPENIQSGIEHKLDFRTKTIDYTDNTVSGYFIGSIYLDGNLCIRRYTPAIAREINLTEHDIGTPISRVFHNFKDENIAQNAVRALNSVVPEEREVRSISGNRYILRYSPCVEYGGRVEGVMISLIKITSLKKIHENFNHLSLAVEQSSCMVMIVNTDGKIEYVNPKFTEITGYDKGEIIGRDFGILKSGVQSAVFYKDLRETIASGKEWRGELCSKKKNGEIYWETASLSPIRDRDGVITHFIAIKEDITGEKIKIEALKNSEGKFRQAFNSIKDLIFLYGVNIKGVPSNLLEVNKFACDMLGYTGEELKTMNIYDLIDEKNIADMHKILTQGHSGFEIYYVCKNGQRLPTRVNCYIFASDGEKFALIIASDVTEQKKTEEALLKSKERYEFLVEYSPYAILIVSSGIILFSNIAGLTMFDVKSVNELIGRPIKKFFNIDIQKLMNEQNIYSDVEGNMVVPLEDRIVKPDGAYMFVEITVMPFFFEGKTATLMMIRDITSRKQAEELQKDIERNKKLLDETIEYDNLKTEFFSNISHELRTPLNGIISTLQLLGMHLKGNTIMDKSGNIIRYTDIIKQNSYRLLRLVNNMIDITRIDAGALELNLHNFNIVSIVEDITMMVADFIANKKISLIFDTDVEEKIIACDPDKIERILLNLLSNAVKFTKPGGQITVNIYNEKDKVLISVKDTGSGIPEDKLNVIFGRFRQVDKLLTRNHEGSGIGLSLVKSLVEMHKGKIFVRSELGKGSEFLVEFPTETLSEENFACEDHDIAKRDNFEKVCIEFSDIYNLN